MHSTSMRIRKRRAPGGRPAGRPLSTNHPESETTNALGQQSPKNCPGRGQELRGPGSTSTADMWRIHNTEIAAARHANTDAGVSSRHVQPIDDADATSFSRRQAPSKSASTSPPAPHCAPSSSSTSRHAKPPMSPSACPAIHPTSPPSSSRAIHAQITPSPPTKVHVVHSLSSRTELPSPPCTIFKHPTTYRTSSSSSCTKSPSPPAQPPSKTATSNPHAASTSSRESNIRNIKHIGSRKANHAPPVRHRTHHHEPKGVSSVPSEYPVGDNTAFAHEGPRSTSREGTRTASCAHDKEAASSSSTQHEGRDRDGRRGQNRGSATRHGERSDGGSASTSVASSPKSSMSPGGFMVGKTRRGDVVPSENETVRISRRLPPRSSLPMTLPRLVSPRDTDDEPVLESPVFPKTAKTATKPARYQDVADKRPQAIANMHPHNMQEGKRPEIERGGRIFEPLSKRRSLLRSEIEKYAPYRQVDGSYRAAVLGGNEIRKTYGSDPRWDREDPMYRAAASRGPSKVPLSARRPLPNTTAPSPRKRKEEQQLTDKMEMTSAEALEGFDEPHTDEEAMREKWQVVSSASGNLTYALSLPNTVPTIGRSYPSENPGIPCCIPSPIVENSLESGQSLSVNLASSSLDEEVPVPGEDFPARLERFHRRLTRFQREQMPDAPASGSKDPGPVPARRSSQDISTTDWKHVLAGCDANSADAAQPNYTLPEAKVDAHVRHASDRQVSPIQVQVTSLSHANVPLQSPLQDAPILFNCSASRDSSPPPISTPRTPAPDDHSKHSDGDDTHSDSGSEDDDDYGDTDSVVEELPFAPSLLTENGAPFRPRSDSSQSYNSYMMHPRRDSIIGVPPHLLQERGKRPSLMLEALNPRKFSHSSAASSRRSSLAPPDPEVPRSPRQSITDMAVSPRAQALCLQNDMRAGKTIGMGQFGRVFLAQENETGKLIAVKEIMLPKPPESNDEEGRKKDDRELASLETELILLQTLEHPNVVHYIGHELSPSTADPERLFIFLEYLAGGSLKQQLNDFGPFCDTLVHKYTRQLVNGIFFLHTYNPPIVHRDLKNANLLLTSNGEIKISDFGCAKVMFEETIKSEPGVHTITGTVPYMAPEVLKGKSLGCSQDIWSLGCCILEMCTAAHPWKGFQLDNILHAYKLIAESTMIPPIPTQRPRPLREFIACCLKRKAQERPDAGYLMTLPFICT
eukprot:GEMP01006221.1.p1 GENE.GEMP01006221.1~~GEMP01006221.1.p1  ORF type:complete len:1215 (+),score=296.53 GEMP01006221.1:45-3647(+)